MTAAPPPGPVIPATRQSTRWLLSHPDNLDEDEQAQLGDIQERCPHLNAPAAHVRSFAEMMARRQGEQELKARLTRIEADDLPELRSFANGIRRDQQAVTAGLTLPCSSAAVEGNVTRKCSKGRCTVTPASPCCANASSFTLANTCHEIRARARNMGQIPDPTSHQRNHRAAVGPLPCLRRCPPGNGPAQVSSRKRSSGIRKAHRRGLSGNPQSCAQQLRQDRRARCQPGPARVAAPQGTGTGCHGGSWPATWLAARQAKRRGGSPHRRMSPVPAPSPGERPQHAICPQGGFQVHARFPRRTGRRYDDPHLALRRPVPGPRRVPHDHRGQAQP